MNKKILFVCSTGIATSTVVAEKVMEFLQKEKGIKGLSYNQSNVASIKHSLSGVDLIVATTKIPYDLDVPIINAVAFLTGIGQDKVLDKIHEAIIGG